MHRGEGIAEKELGLVSLLAGDGAAGLRASRGVDPALEVAPVVHVVGPWQEKKGQS